ncbi:glycosyltransferase family 2 protein [Spirosoma radiotolerans]|uniref:Glycosyl transferase family 2 n=1 Tax=Spirosoma radiotolerans TaxID=1379870 RepID=A0A0E3ZS33_9BACT|nr:glycosyltransferase family 2 protein [Spirosoma radiotolerans]AKD53935.1 glycosyl transferase family 2 [Spirosoma radiotolerans]
MSPTISIITITYNAERFLERTIRSVVDQQATDIEYIVIDGASTDGTLSIIKQYQTSITRWLSEPDQGLYDAMNKGLHQATGQYVWFMNAGDEIHDPDVVSKLLARIKATEADVYYSDALFVRDVVDQVAVHTVPVGLRSQVTPHVLPKNLTWRDMALGMKVCHQAFVVKRDLAPDYLLTNLSADLDWEIRCLKKAQKIEFLPFVLCRYLVGGVSVQQHRRSLTDRFKVLVQHFGLLTTLRNHMMILWRAGRFKVNI